MGIKVSKASRSRHIHIFFNLKSNTTPFFDFYIKL